MMRWTQLSTALMVGLFLTACQTTPLPEVNHTVSGTTACAEPRPDVCTMQYQPACGYGETGQVFGTFGNACGACQQSEVASYTDGACR